MFCFRLRRFDFHKIVSLYSSDYDSDYNSVAIENLPLTDTSIRRTPGAGPGRFLVILL